MHLTCAMEIMSCCFAFLIVIPQAPLKIEPDIIVPLTFNLSARNLVWMTVDLAGESTPERGVISTGVAPGGVKISLSKATKSEAVGEVSIRNTELQEAQMTYSIGVGKSIGIEVTRILATGRAIKLPYLLIWNRETGPNNEVVESLSWSPNYRVEGTFQIGSCKATIAAFDINGDGVFDSRDFLMGTSIGLDRNGDGKISGQDEWLTGNQIIEFCGRRFLIKKLAEDGSFVTLTPTPLRPPKVGEMVPDLLLTSIQGKRILTAEFKGQVTVLDFWASWCGPCIGAFPNLKRLQEGFDTKFNVIAFNVDDSARLGQARGVVEKYKMSWPVVMQGLGQDDPVWKVFGSMADNRLGIPLYVVIRKDGIIAYAGNGGKDLEELRDRLAEVIK